MAASHCLAGRMSSSIITKISPPDALKAELRAEDFPPLGCHIYRMGAPLKEADVTTSLVESFDPLSTIINSVLIPDGTATCLSASSVWRKADARSRVQIMMEMITYRRS